MIDRNYIVLTISYSRDYIEFCNIEHDWYTAPTQVVRTWNTREPSTPTGAVKRRGECLAVG